MYDKKYASVEMIVSKWNPLEVPPDLATDEYKAYINRILSVGKSLENIKQELITILTCDLGLNYDDNDLFQRGEVEKITIEIFNSIN